jgi:hypothetical protein
MGARVPAGRRDGAGSPGASPKTHRSILRAPTSPDPWQILFHLEPQHPPLDGALHQLRVICEIGSKVGEVLKPIG